MDLTRNDTITYYISVHEWQYITNKEIHNSLPQYCLHKLLFLEYDNYCVSMFVTVYKSINIIL